MYSKILVTLENGRADAAVLSHVTQLAKQVGASLVLLHVADGWAARNFKQLKLAESDEMRGDQDYLDKTAAGLREQGLAVETLLALGNPPTEIVKIAASQHCDLIALASHGHKLIGDLLHGSTIDRVRHNTTIPLLVVNASKATSRPPA